MLPWLWLEAETREVVTMPGIASGWHVVLDVRTWLARRAGQWSCWPLWLAEVRALLNGRRGRGPPGLARRGRHASG